MGRLSSVGCICNSPDIKVKGHHHGFFAFPSPFLLGEKMVVLKVSVNYTTRLTQHNLLPVCTHSDNILTHCVCCAGIVHSRAPYTELPDLQTLSVNMHSPNNCLYEVPNLYEIYWIMWTLNHRLRTIVFYLIQRPSIMTAHCTSLSLPRTARDNWKCHLIVLRA